MTKSEARQARKAGTLRDYEARDDKTDGAMFSETARGYRARERWARHYNALNGAPENDNDR